MSETKIMEMSRACRTCKTQIEILCRWEQHSDNKEQPGMVSPCNSCKHRDADMSVIPCEFCTAVINA